MNTKVNVNKPLVFGMVIVLLVAILSMTLVACNTNTDTDKTAVNSNDNGQINDFSAEIVSTEHVKLAMGEAMAAADGGSVSKTITATVLPATAINKKVDWSVEWGDASNTGAVTDYVTVTADSDGSTNATVTCYQAFAGNIVVTVTTRESGYTASCIVTFVGVPTDIAVSGSVSPYGAIATYDLGIGQTYTFTVAPTNAFNSVSSTYNNIACTLSGNGSLVVGYYDTAFGWSDSSIHNVTVDSVKDKFISAEYANGQLTITTKKSMESYYASVKRADGGRTSIYTDKFKEYADDCYFTIVLHEQTSNIRKEIHIRFDGAVVTGVSASVPEMVF